MEKDKGLVEGKSVSPWLETVASGDSVDSCSRFPVAFLSVCRKNLGVFAWPWLSAAGEIL